MKTRVFAYIILNLLIAANLHAAFPAYQNRGAVDVGSMTIVQVTTTPVLCLSTGSNMVYSTNYFSESSAQFIFNSSGTPPTQVRGQYMSERLYIEFFNDTSTDTWVGYNQNVSTQAGSNYGRRIPPGASWSHDGSIQQYWVVASTTTERKFVITQEK